MKYVYKDNLSKFVRFAENIFGIKEGSEEKKAVQGINCLKDFYSGIGAPVSLKEIGLSENDLDRLAENAALSEPLGVLRRLNRNDIYEIFKLALG